jgi:hypothetical protein
MRASFAVFLNPPLLLAVADVRFFLFFAGVSASSVKHDVWPSVGTTVKPATTTRARRSAHNIACLVHIERLRDDRCRR